MFDSCARRGRPRPGVLFPGVLFPGVCFFRICRPIRLSRYPDGGRLADRPQLRRARDGRRNPFPCLNHCSRARRARSTGEPRSSGLCCAGVGPAGAAARGLPCRQNLSGPQRLPRAPASRPPSLRRGRTRDRSGGGEPRRAFRNGRPPPRRAGLHPRQARRPRPQGAWRARPCRRFPCCRRRRACGRRSLG